MNDIIRDLKAKMLESTELLKQVASNRSRRTGRSPNTEHDYLGLGQTLLTRAKAADGGLIGVVSNTRRPTTFQKRISALRFAATDGIASQPSDQMISLAGAGQTGSISRQRFFLTLQLRQCPAHLGGLLFQTIS